MQMAIKTAKWWSKRGFACTSLALSLAEIVIMWGAAAIVQTSEQQQHMRLIRNVVDDTWILGGLSSLGFAVAGLVADSHRMTAFVAVIVAIVAFSICGLLLISA
jgi:hypothetical protein